eukprot:jgi/Chlat1/2707/Chrsp180S02876
MWLGGRGLHSARLASQSEPKNCQQHLQMHCNKAQSTLTQPQAAVTITGYKSSYQQYPKLEHVNRGRVPGPAAEVARRHS